jgi:hypothetical protein
MLVESRPAIVMRIRVAGHALRKYRQKNAQTTSGGRQAAFDNG